MSQHDADAPRLAPPFHGSDVRSVQQVDTEHLQHILQQFGAIPGVRDTRTTVVLTTLKETRALPLETTAQDAATENTQGADE